SQVGTAEFVHFCRQVAADPLLTVNMESDGRERWANPPKVGSRKGTAAEAAAWVSYCNDPDDKLRRKHGVKKPYDVRMWQIGNETSYDKRGFDLKKGAERTKVFARAMKRADPSI